MQKLGNTESDLLSVQVTAYLDNKIEVATLLEDSDTKTAALQKVSELEEALSYVSTCQHCAALHSGTKSCLRDVPTRENVRNYRMN